MTDKTYSEEEVKNREMFIYGEVWFIEALAHTANLVNQRQFSPKAHEMGLRIFQQFITPQRKEDQQPPAE